ncbi:S-methyl-5-thioribose-1-phosphate isomerase [Candidatus Woesearchaeota archaeon]|nr:S-methyl-5-thioribose-1-phosphate isomerase [Candidatus Woesearchaeota archaeon]
MHIKGKNYRTVWYEKGIIYLIDQPKLPHSFRIAKCFNHNEVYDAIKDMIVRGAPAIGAAGCFGMAQAIRNYDGEGDLKEYIDEISAYLKSARPTAYDLTHGINHILEAIKNKPIKKAKIIAEEEAQKYADSSVEACKKIGEYGNRLIKEGSTILTHCNAGALATVDYGTALAPIRIAKEKGKNIHVFADETRPRCQGARLTAFELAEENISHDIIADNAAGLLMKQNKISLVITGADRITLNGDAANKIGTYEKAVLACENDIPFYIAAPFSTIDFSCKSGNEIPIEERSGEEVLYMWGWSDNGNFERVRISPEKSTARNPAFDVTPAGYITGIITEKGIFKPREISRLRENA